MGGQLMGMRYLAALLLCLASLCLAQAPALGLEELMHAALQKNAEVQSQAGEQRIAALKGRQALTRVLPQLDGEASYLKTSGRADLPDLVGANGLDERIAWLSLHQTLFDAETLAGLAGARLAQRQEVVRTDQQRQQTLLEVIEAYFAALQAQGEVEVLDANLAAFKLLGEQSQVLYEAGAVPELDAKKSRVEYLLQQHERARAGVEYQAALNHLKEVVGKMVADPLALQPFPERPVHLDSLETYLSAAQQKRPELHLALLEAEARRRDQRAASLAQFPTAETGAYYGWDSDRPLAQARRGWQVYVALRLPIWHWGSMELERQIAQVRCRQSEVLGQQLEQQVAQEVRAVFAECQVQGQQVQAAQEAIAVAEEAGRMAREGYQEGAVTALAVVDAQRLLTQARMEGLQAKYGFYLAKARLCHRSGELEEGIAWLE